MECPSKKFLQSFACDPDLALEANPEFGPHLAECTQCQLTLDNIGKVQQSAEVVDFFSGEHQGSDSFPHVEGYTILEFIAAGTSGAVYKARQDRTDRLVALKLVHSLTSEQRERIHTERRTLINCDHPNIVQLIDCGSIQGGGYLATRWVETSMGQYVRNTPIVDLQSAVDWLIQITVAISHLHNLGIIHRDLKLSNVLLTEDGVPKLTDFGIAKDMSLQSTLTAPQTPLGTPGYMAPEQTGQSSYQVGIATDIYGLGAVMYHLITGRQPFVGSDAMQVIAQVVHDAPISPRKLRPEIPKDVETICLKCLEKDPADRYGSSLELAEDLKRYRVGDAIIAKPITNTTMLLRTIRKHQAVSTLVAILVFTLLTGIAYILHSRRLNAQQQEQLAREALLDSIASASVDRLPALFVEASSKIGSDFSSLSLQNSSASERLRWLCIEPHSNQIEISPKDLIEVVSTLSCQELALLLPKFAESHLTQSNEHKLALNEAIEVCKQGQATLRFVTFRSAFDAHWSPSQTSTRQVLAAIAEATVDESLLWARLLDRVKEPLTLNLLGEVDRFDLLKSPSLRKAVWHWMNRDVKHIAEFIKSIPTESIGEMRSLSPQMRQAAAELVQMEYQSLREKIEPAISSKAITRGLQELLNEGSGSMWTSRGMVSSLKRDRVHELIAALAENQLSLLTIQPYDIGEQKLFCAVFESSIEPCEVDWSVPLQDMQSQMAHRREKGFEAVCVWIDMSKDSDQLTVLWRKGDWKPSQFFHGDIADVNSTVSAGDDDTTKTQVLHQYCQLGSENREIAIKTGQRCSWVNDSTRRFLHMDSQHVNDKIVCRTTHKLEFRVDLEEILGIKKSEPAEHFRQQARLAGMGFEPFFVFAEPETGQLGSHWYRRKTSNDSEHRDLAKLALVGWVLGDTKLVLETLESVECAAARTEVIENLYSIEPNADRLIHCLNAECEPAQLYGLLMALANYPVSAVEESSNFQDRLQWCWMHDDSGVHFAADHILRLMLPKAATPVIHAEHTARFGLEKLPNGRKWFYGILGLPFVIVEKEVSSIYGFDEHIPWSVTIDRHLEQIDRRFAICAVEIPQDLIEQYLIEQEPEIGRHDFGNPINGPAMGLSLDMMLRYCRWLNETENIPSETRGLPMLSDIRGGMQISKDFWEVDGYRLPNNVEWETAFRCGTRSRHFLGDSFEYMQEYCWDSTNCEQNPKPIATRKPNPWGMFDIAGNLYEAVLGDHRNISTPESSIWDDKRLDKDTILDIRGGSFLSSHIYSSAGSHHHIRAMTGDINCGFRIARTLPKIRSAQ